MPVEPYRTKRRRELTVTSMAFLILLVWAAVILACAGAVVAVVWLLSAAL